jgi:hypothetical protein
MAVEREPAGNDVPGPPVFPPSECQFHGELNQASTGFRRIADGLGIRADETREKSAYSKSSQNAIV